MTDIFAWTGVGILALLLALWGIVWLVGLLSDPVGRAVMLAMALVAATVWGVLGGIYLIMEKT